MGIFLYVFWKKTKKRKIILFQNLICLILFFKGTQLFLIFKSTR